MNNPRTTRYGSLFLPHCPVRSDALHIRPAPACKRPEIQDRRPETGVALGLVLVAVALMIAIGVAILATSNSGSGSYNDRAARVAGAALLGQARNLRAGIEAMTSRGISISAITFDTAASTGLFNPANNAADPQPVTYPDLLDYSDSPGWVWKVDASGNPVVKIDGLGVSSNPDYILVLPDTSYQACLGVNLLLYGNPVPPSMPDTNFSDWATPATPIDLSASGSLGGYTEGCFAYTDGGGNTRNVFISPVRAE